MAAIRNHVSIYFNLLSNCSNDRFGLNNVITPKTRQKFRALGRRTLARQERQKEKVADYSTTMLFVGRDEATRTPDPYVPNVVRYQLRYIPMLLKAGAKLQHFFEIRALFRRKIC